MIGMLVLVFFPFLYGIALSFTGSTLYNSDKSILENWIGIENYVDILSDFSVVKKAEGGLVVSTIRIFTGPCCSQLSGRFPMLPSA